MTNCGWESQLGVLVTSDRAQVLRSLQSFIGDASESQIRAWGDEIKILQSAGGAALSAEPNSANFHSILEYPLPLESRRPDVIFLENGNVLVLEFKGKPFPTPADIDQVAAYARDLRNYHRECINRPVFSILVPARYQGPQQQVSGTYIVGPHELEGVLTKLSQPVYQPALPPASFLSADAYSPLPSLVKAARELFESKTIRNVWRARALTDPAVNLIAKITHEAARTKTRRLILLTGSPGSGKTLVGLRAVHAGFLDDLAVDRGNGKPTAPAVFLSGNGPLVQVLQYELKCAGGSGKAFVRDVKDYVKAYSKASNPIPPQHFLVFDEAQRAWDAAQVALKHPNPTGKSEPEHFIDFVDRIPEWGVVLGLIGTGQEINRGEEGGIIQWVRAIQKSQKSAEWVVHMPPELAAEFSVGNLKPEPHKELSLEAEVRFHMVTKIHQLVEGILGDKLPENIAELVKGLALSPYPIYLTRDLNKAKAYVKERYEENPDARYGLLASARDRDLPRFGILNQYQDTINMQIAPWFSEGEEHEGSCRHLERPVTEFGAQGLELDFSIVCWGTDLIREKGLWSDARARGFKDRSAVKNPKQLRINSYRVLMTRGRDGMIIYVPSLPQLEETYNYLKLSNIQEL